MLTLILLIIVLRALFRPRWFYRPWGLWGFPGMWSMRRGPWHRPPMGGPFGPGPGVGRFGRF